MTDTVEFAGEADAAWTKMHAVPARVSRSCRSSMRPRALLGEGRTNRQIADALFISVKTASVHVSNILPSSE